MKSPKQGNLFMLILLIYQITMTIFIGGFFYSAENVWIVQIVFQILSFILPFIFYSFFTKSKITDTLMVKPLSFKNIVYIFVISIFMQPLAMFISLISSMFFDNNVGKFVNDLTAYPFPFVLFTVAVVPAFCEEIIFRGIIFSNYKNADIKKAVLINGFFFGIMHMDLHQFTYAFALGILLTYLVYYTKSIWASVLSHFLINASQTILSYFITNPSDEQILAQEHIGASTKYDVLLADIMSILPILLLCSFILYYVFNSFAEYNRSLNANQFSYESITTKLFKKTKVFTWEFFACALFFTIISILVQISRFSK